MIRKAHCARVRRTRSILLMGMLLAFLSGPAFANKAPDLGQPVQTKMLAKVCGKGEPINLPKMHSGNPGVVLWDELPGKGGKGNNIQIGSMNLQNNTMMSTR
ncbi:hypothetical protein AB4090_09530 [Acidithiobacillus sp. IBUN Pt1247-S3]